MKKILTILIGVLLAIPSFADGFEYLEHCKALYNNGRFEEAKQGFSLCKVYAELNSADMDAWISKCDSAIAERKNRAAAAARKVEAERKAAYEESQRLRKENRLVFVSSNAMNLFGEEVGFETAMRKSLTSAKYKCTTDPELALWSVYVTANAREAGYIQEEGRYCSYVDVVIQLQNEMTGEILFEDELHQQGGSDKSFAIATRDAYLVANKKIGTVLVSALNDINQ